MTELLAESDLRAVMAVIEEARRGEPTEGMPWTLWDRLIALVRCDVVQFCEVDEVNGRAVLMQRIEDDDRELHVGDEDPPLPAEFWRYLRVFQPCVYPVRTGDLSTVVRWSDFYTPAELLNAPLHAEYDRPDGFHHGMHAALPAPHGHIRKLSFRRGRGSDFSERERLLVELLRPHLWEIYFDGQRRRRPAPHLTKREWEVLQLVREGLSNAEIAGKLFISLATVRKHIEHILERTGTRNRMAAAALMMHHRTDIPDPRAAP